MENEPKIKRSRAETAEIVVVVLLGLVTLLTAWAAWMGSLHSGVQATNYTKSNNLANQGNSQWNEAVTNLSEDMQLYSDFNELRIEYTYAEEHGNKGEMDKLDWKLTQLENDSITDELMEAIQWADDQEEYASPFDKEGFVDSYFADAQATLDESQAAMEEGQKDNENSDKFGLVSVIYSVILFLLGISSSIRSDRNRKTLILISIAGIVIATLYMLFIPLPTGFSILGFFK